MGVERSQSLENVLLPGSGGGGILRLLECVTECVRSPLSESKAVVGEERIQIHSGHSQPEMALALHVELPGALGYSVGRGPRSQLLAGLMLQVPPQRASWEGLREGFFGQREGASVPVVHTALRPPCLGPRQPFTSGITSVLLGQAMPCPHPSSHAVGTVLSCSLAHRGPLHMKTPLFLATG